MFYSQATRISLAAGLRFALLDNGTPVRGGAAQASLREGSAIGACLPGARTSRLNIEIDAIQSAIGAVVGDCGQSSGMTV